MFLPLVSRAVATKEGISTANDFRDGKMKGFVIGSVPRDDIAYYQALAATRANLGRIFFPFQKCRNCDRFGRSPNHVASLQRVLDWLRGRGIRLVVVGDFAGVDQPGFWGDKALRDSFVDNWRWFARTFGNDPAIAGLDLLNEPNPPSRSGDLAEATSSWRPLAGLAIEAIRQEGVSLPVVLEGVFGGSAHGLRDLLPFEDPQVVYSVHHYSPHEITHQHVHANWTRTIPYPAGVEWRLGGWDPELGVTAYDRRRLEDDLRHAIAFQKRYKVPIYVGEFSCVRWAPGRSRERYINDCLNIYRKYGWSWTFHEFRGWPGWDAEIESEVRDFTVRSVDAPVMNLLRNEIATGKTDN